MCGRAPGISGMIQVLKVQAGRVQNGQFKPVDHITDRAKRYRANSTAPARHPCAFCGNPKVRGVAHIDGNEANLDRRNLTWTCNSCNVRTANTLRKAGLENLTRQYNPRHAAADNSSFKQYGWAVSVMRGQIAGDVKAAT